MSTSSKRVSDTLALIDPPFLMGVIFFHTIFSSVKHVHLCSGHTLLKYLRLLCSCLLSASGSWLWAQSEMSQGMKLRGERFLLHIHISNGARNALGLLTGCIYCMARCKGQQALPGDGQLSSTKELCDPAKGSIYIMWEPLSTRRASCWITTDTGPCKWIPGRPFI